MEGIFEMARDYRIRQTLKENPEIKKAVEEKFKNSNQYEDTEDEEKENQQKKRKNQADVIVEIALSEKIVLFHNDLKEPFALIPVGSHSEIYPMTSKSFKLWLSNKCYQITGKTVTSESLKGAINTLSGIAIFEGEQFILYNRIAALKGTIYYDLSNKDWKAVQITSKDWQLKNPPIIFRRYSHQQEQCIPHIEGNIDKLLDYINLKSGNSLLFKVYIISLFIPNISHPIITLFGERGAAKTTTIKLIKKLVDPSKLEAVTFPKDINELIQKLSHHWFLGYDNISTIPDWISDTLCRVVTGEGFSKRQLFTDDEDIIYNFKRCIALNGINVVATREDLLDRCLLFELERITTETRKEELVFWKEFEKDKPFILGGIFNILSKALAEYPNVKLNELQRMADFTRWGYAIAEAIDKGLGEQFLNEYTQNINRQNEEAINANPLAIAIISFMKSRDSWGGTASDLLREIKDVADNLQIDTKNKFFPSSSSHLSRYLNRLKTNLKDVGIIYTNKHSYLGSDITLTRYNKTAVKSVMSSKTPQILDLKHDASMTRHLQMTSNSKDLPEANLDDTDDNLSYIEDIFK